MNSEDSEREKSDARDFIWQKKAFKNIEEKAYQIIFFSFKETQDDKY